ncbi:hypothetical protein CRG98_043048 [Punica granatum]|uniref:Uncharacterized protein n=1 Tax=Punica granatum TaxID=22663 RepID=A0A2I0HXY0_PUNGR|nr:hypothetical protein CRG98_043048 [Punica granatum]
MEGCEWDGEGCEGRNGLWMLREIEKGEVGRKVMDDDGRGRAIKEKLVEEHLHIALRMLEPTKPLNLSIYFHPSSRVRIEFHPLLGFRTLTVFMLIETRTAKKHAEMSLQIRDNKEHNKRDIARSTHNDNLQCGSIGEDLTKRESAASNDLDDQISRVEKYVEKHVEDDVGITLVMLASSLKALGNKVVPRVTNNNKHSYEVANHHRGRGRLRRSG